MRFTVLGGSGFIGSRLVRYLRADGHECVIPGRRYEEWLEEDLGVVVYCVGVTADFRTRAIDTVDAHVCHLLPLLRRGRFSSLVYLSSTRVYGPGSTSSGALALDPADPDHLYNASKLMGEATCLTARPDTVKIARLSNVYGDDATSPNFLASVVRAAARQGHVHLDTSLESERDYLSVQDAVAAIAYIAVRGKRRLYNVAYGENRRTGDILDVLRRETGCTVTVAPHAPTVKYPAIDVAPLRAELELKPRDVLAALPELVALHKQGTASRSC